MRALKDILSNWEEEGGTDVNDQGPYGYSPLYLQHPNKPGIWMVQKSDFHGVHVINLLGGNDDCWHREEYVTKVSKLTITIDEVEEGTAPVMF